MNPLDLALVLFVVLGTLGGFVSGFAKAVASLTGLILGFVLGSLYFPSLAPFFLRWTGKAAVAGLLSFTVIALGVALLLEALGSAAARLVRLLRLQVIDRPLGIVPAGISTVLIAGVALALLNGFAILERQRAESRLASWFLHVSGPVIELLPPPWNGRPEKLLPRPVPAPDMPLMGRRTEAGDAFDGDPAARR